MDRSELSAYLTLVCRDCGSRADWARRHGIPANNITDVIHGRREPSKRLLEAVGIERVVSVSYRRPETKPQAPAAVASEP